MVSSVGCGALDHVLVRVYKNVIVFGFKLNVGYLYYHLIIRLFNLFYAILIKLPGAGLDLYKKVALGSAFVISPYKVPCIFISTVDPAGGVDPKAKVKVLLFGVEAESLNSTVPAPSTILTSIKLAIVDVN